MPSTSRAARILPPSRTPAPAPDPQNLISCGAIQSEEEVDLFLGSTLLSIQHKDPEELSRARQEAIGHLTGADPMFKFAVKTEDGRFRPTPLGVAATANSWKPEDALEVYEDVRKAAEEGLVLAQETDLHPLYLLTPKLRDFEDRMREKQWRALRSHLLRLQRSALERGLKQPLEFRILQRIGLNAEQLIATIQRQSEPFPSWSSNAEARRSRRRCVRLFCCLILSDLIKERAVEDIVKDFEVTPRDVLALQDQAHKFAGQVVYFLEKQNWVYMMAPLAGLQARILTGTKVDLTSLTEIAGVGIKVAKALYKEGFRTPEAVAEAAPQELKEALGRQLSESRLSVSRMIESAKEVCNRRAVLRKAEATMRRGADLFLAGLDMGTLAALGKRRAEGRSGGPPSKRARQAPTAPLARHPAAALPVVPGLSEAAAVTEVAAAAGAEAEDSPGEGIASSSLGGSPEVLSGCPVPWIQTERLLPVAVDPSPPASQPPHERAPATPPPASPSATPDAADTTAADAMPATGPVTTADSNAGVPNVPNPPAPPVVSAPASRAAVLAPPNEDSWEDCGVKRGRTAGRKRVWPGPSSAPLPTRPLF